MTEDENLVRYRRNREIDQVAIGLGLAYNTPQHGICYWHAHAADAFRKGYEAGLAKPRSSHEQIATAERLSVRGPAVIGVYVAYRRCGCFQGVASVGTPELDKSAADYVKRWIKAGCIVKPLTAEAAYPTGDCPVHSKVGG